MEEKERQMKPFSKYHETAKSQGRIARLYGFDINSQNPYEKNTHGWKSFRAGWNEVENDPDAPKEPLLVNNA